MQGSKYTPEQKSRALAALQMGKGTEVAAIESDASARTVRRWRQQMAEVGLEQWMPENVQVIHMTTDLIMDGLETIKAAKTAHNHLGDLNALRGTSIDKLQRASTPGHGVALRITHPDGTTTEVLAS